MDKYTVLTGIGLAMCIIMNVASWLGGNIPMAVDLIVSVIGAIFMIVGLYYRNRK